MLTDHTTKAFESTDDSARPAQGRRAAASRDTIKVCHVSMTLETGGLEKLLVDFGRHRDRSRFDLQFLTLNGHGHPAEELREQGYRVETTSGCGGRLARIKRMARIMRECRVQVVHTHNTHAHFYGALAARMAGVPVVINTQHGRGCGRHWKARWQFRIANLLTARIIGVSEDSTALCRLDDPWSSNRMEAIWNGIDLQRFEYRGPAHEPLAISVSRLSPEKDLATLIRAVWIVVKDCPRFRLKIVGEGPERPNLERLVAELGLQHAVEFAGEQHDIPAQLRQAAFFVSSSRTEGISLTLLEAMAVGLPVITTRVGGNPEIVLDGSTGRLVRSESPDQLAGAILDLLDLPEAWPVMGELGRQRVEQHFNVKHTVRQYEALYLELLRDARVLSDGIGDDVLSRQNARG